MTDLLIVVLRRSSGHTLLAWLFVLFHGECVAQGDQEIMQLEAEISRIEHEADAVRERIEDIKLESLRASLGSSGLPSENYVMHSGMALDFDPETHQARWVAHIITPDITSGTIARTNDFRDDPMVEGEAVERDYFLRFLEEDSTYRYDGFGYDRGHLAPSADFRWSRKALSESYYYTNMSPQDPEFNREDWAELEAILRGYVRRNECELYVVTMPVIESGAERIERGVNQLAIPQRFIKLAFDPLNGRGIGFIMENEKQGHELPDFAVSIDRVEEMTGLDFFHLLDDDRARAEATFDLADWFPEETRDGVRPLHAPSLPSGFINTTQASRWMGAKEKVHVCGTVVGTRFSGSGNYWLNLDKKFPNTVFSVYIRKDDFKNFDRIDKEYLVDEKVCFYGKVTEMFSQPNMNIVRQEQVVLDF